MAMSIDAVINKYMVGVRTNQQCLFGKLKTTQHPVVTGAAAPTLALAFLLDDIAGKRINRHRLERSGDSLPIFSGKPCELLSRRFCDDYRSRSWRMSVNVTYSPRAASASPLRMAASSAFVGL